MSALLLPEKPTFFAWVAVSQCQGRNLGRGGKAQQSGNHSTSLERAANELENRHRHNRLRDQTGSMIVSGIAVLENVRKYRAIAANGVVPSTAASVLARSGQGMGAARVGGARNLFFDASRLEIPSRAIRGDGRRGVSPWGHEQRLAMNIQCLLFAHKQTCGGDWTMQSAGMSRRPDRAHRCSAGIAV
jgi:hypothetical protein